MNRKQEIILELLANGEQNTGLELIDRSENRLKRGTVYVHLTRLQDAGLVTYDTVEVTVHGHCWQRRKYRATETGRKAGWGLIGPRLVLGQ